MNMRRYSLVFLICMGFLLPILCIVKEAGAEVNINVNIGPPPITVAEPPDVIVIPGSRISFVPRPDIDIFFYDGWWWSPRGPHWYRSRAYGGPWRVIRRRYVPAPIISMPHNYRAIYVREKPIPYGQWKKGYRHPGKGHPKGWAKGADVPPPPPGPPAPPGPQRFSAPPGPPVPQGPVGGPDSGPPHGKGKGHWK